MKVIIGFLKKANLINIRRANTKIKNSIQITKDSNEKGSALLEASIVLPFLLISALGIFDFGRMYYTYNMVSEIAREAALQGAKIPALEGNLVNNYFEHELDNPNAPVEDMGGHRIIRSRIRLARSLLAETLPIPVTSIRSRSQCVAENSLDLNAGDGSGRALKVQVEADYQPIYLRALPVVTIRAEEVISYLGSAPCQPVVPPVVGP